MTAYIPKESDVFNAFDAGTALEHPYGPFTATNERQRLTKQAPYHITATGEPGSESIRLGKPVSIAEGTQHWKFYHKEWKFVRVL